MLQIRDVSKKYLTGGLVQQALDGVTLNLRDCEFVAVLGPSGSGKTTLLNIIGGLDRYDKGDLIINGISTKKYKDRDWDSYRNHTIGFVFQSYNLIPHQSILANVELALTISGIPRRERRRRAAEALKKVGLGDQLHKKPNQMSGGQMQRVAIARALVNNPDILLADEPTGALDTETSLQVMELLREVAQDRLVIMVTHNPELAEQYATRTIKLRDGRVIDDTDPYTVEKEKPSAHKNMGKSSMGFLTALSLSFNNLRTKKARTILTSFAGSIGIIGIALILSLSTGVNLYIEDIQRDTMTAYPITINAKTIDLTSIMDNMPRTGNVKQNVDHELDAIYSDGSRLEMANSLTNSLTENNLTEFKSYLDNPDSPIHQYLGENGALYSYDVPFRVYAKNEDDEYIDANVNAFATVPTAPGAMANVQSAFLGNMSSIVSSDSFEEMLPGVNGALVSNATIDSYELVGGAWPSSYNEVVLIVDEYNELPMAAMYALGMIPSDDYNKIMESIQKGEDVEIGTYTQSYSAALERDFYLIPASDCYREVSDGLFEAVGTDKSEVRELVKDAIVLHVSGIIRPLDDAPAATLTGAVGYTNALTQHLIDHCRQSAVVQAQQAQPEINILSGMHFSPDSDKEKISDAKEYLSTLGISEKAKLWRNLASMALADQPEQLAAMQKLGEMELAAMADQYFATATDEVFLSLYDTYISTGTYEENMSAFGFVSLDAPTSISLYADTFENKDLIAQCITDYNKDVPEESQITYTDLVAMMTSSITTIINVISYVLIAFVSVSLIVSSIMIGIITYISVLERTKEIGILRAIGASKHNISQVFNAETFIVGLLSGFLGVGTCCLLLIPGNAVIHSLIGSNDINATLPVQGAVILIILSVILTLIGGLLPAKKAARQDPVKALRSE